MKFENTYRKEWLIPLRESGWLERVADFWIEFEEFFHIFLSLYALTFQTLFYFLSLLQLLYLHLVMPCNHHLSLNNGSFDLIMPACIHIFQGLWTFFLPFQLRSMTHNVGDSLLTILLMFLSFCQFAATYLQDPHCGGMQSVHLPVQGEKNSYHWAGWWQ